MRHHRWSIAIPGVVLVLGLVSCAPAAPQPTTAPSSAAKAPAGQAAGQPSGPPIKIGFIAPLSGPVAVYGAGVKHAPTLVLRETNESGGINGSPLEVVTFDSPNNPNQTVTGLRRLANEDKVFAIVGPYYTGEMQAAVPILKELKVPALAYTPAASYPGLVEPNEWAFLADTDESVTVSVALDGFKKAYPNIKKMAVVGDVQTAVTALTIKEVWPKSLPQKGYEIVDTITYQFNTTDFSPIVTRIKASGAEGIALSSLSPAGPNLMKELERQGLKLPIVASSHLQTVPPLPKILGNTADGFVQTMYFSPDDLQKPKVKEWVEEYEAAAMADNPGGERPIVGYANEVQAYDAFAVMVQAIRDSGVKPETPPAEAREKVRQALMNIKDFPGVLRPKEITAQGRITWDTYALIAKDGEYRTIE